MVKHTIGVIEDEEKYRLQIESILRKEERIERILFWNSAEEFWRQGRDSKTDLLCIDIQMPHMNGIELAKLIKGERPECPILMLTTAASNDTIYSAIKAGASGYILKMEMDALPEAIRKILAGKADMSPTVALRVMEHFRTKKLQPSILTPAETQVLKLLGEGMRTRDIAELLTVKECTIKTHIRHIYDKLEMEERNRNRTMLLRIARERGWLAA